MVFWHTNYQINRKKKGVILVSIRDGVLAHQLPNKQEKERDWHKLYKINKERHYKEYRMNCTSAILSFIFP